MTKKDPPKSSTDHVGCSFNSSHPSGPSGRTPTPTFTHNDHDHPVVSGRCPSSGAPGGNESADPSPYIHDTTVSQSNNPVNRGPDATPTSQVHLPPVESVSSQTEFKEENLASFAAASSASSHVPTPAANAMQYPTTDLIDLIDDNFVIKIQATAPLQSLLPDAIGYQPSLILASYEDHVASLHPSWEKYLTGAIFDVLSSHASGDQLHLSRLLHSLPLGTFRTGGRYRPLTPVGLQILLEDCFDEYLPYCPLPEHHIITIHLDARSLTCPIHWNNIDTDFLGTSSIRPLADATLHGLQSRPHSPVPGSPVSGPPVPDPHPTATPDDVRPQPTPNFSATGSSSSTSDNSRGSSSFGSGGNPSDSSGYSSGGYTLIPTFTHSEYVHPLPPDHRPSPGTLGGNQSPDPSLLAHDTALTIQNSHTVISSPVTTTSGQSNHDFPPITFCQNVGETREALQNLTETLYADNQTNRSDIVERIMNGLRQYPELAAEYLLELQVPYSYHYDRVFPLSFLVYDYLDILALEVSLELVREVYDYYPEAVSTVDNNGLLPLNYACNSRASEDVITFLLEKTPSTAIASNEKCIPLLGYLKASTDHFQPRHRIRQASKAIVDKLQGTNPEYFTHKKLCGTMVSIALNGSCIEEDVLLDVMRKVPPLGYFTYPGNDPDIELSTVKVKALTLLLPGLKIFKCQPWWMAEEAFLPLVQCIQQHDSLSTLVLALPRCLDVPTVPSSALQGYLESTKTLKNLVLSAWNRDHEYFGWQDWWLLILALGTYKSKRRVERVRFSRFAIEHGASLACFLCNPMAPFDVDMDHVSLASWQPSPLLSFSPVQELTISGNEWNNEWAGFLSELSSMPCLTELELDNEQAIKEDGLRTEQAITSLLEQNRLKSLDIAFPDQDSKIHFKIADVLRSNSALQYYVVSGCNGKVFDSFLDLLKNHNTTLEQVCLFGDIQYGGYELEQNKLDYFVDLNACGRKMARCHATNKDEFVELLCNVVGDSANNNSANNNQREEQHLKKHNMHHGLLRERPSLWAV